MKAADRSRVKLNGREGTDYINANFLSGLVRGSEKCYIATQGPLESTIEDFWRMVWELNVSCVIMLTHEVENGVLKCSKYWVENGESVDLQNGLKLYCRQPHVNENDEIVACIFDLTDSTKTIRVSQIHYVAWPDHGLPKSTLSFLKIIELADKLNYSRGISIDFFPKIFIFLFFSPFIYVIFLKIGPLVVHCSAGLGRSGTFCVIHSALTKIKADLTEGISEIPKSI